MMELLMGMLDEFEEMVVYARQVWEGTQRQVLVIDVDSEMPIFQDEELLEQFMEVLDELGEAEYYDDFTFYELPSFDVVVVGDCIH